MSSTELVVSFQFVVGRMTLLIKTVPAVSGHRYRYCSRSIMNVNHKDGEIKSEQENRTENVSDCFRELDQLNVRRQFKFKVLILHH